MSNESQTSSVFPLGFDPYLVRYGSLFLLIVGTFGNVVSFIIFSHGTLRKSSTFRYLALLSLMDLLVLYSGLLDLFLSIEYNGAFSLRSLHPITCRLHAFVTYWSQHSSSWILSFISVDRAIATNCIQFARKFCTPRSADYIVASIIVIVALLNCHELAYLDLQDEEPIKLSSVKDDHTTIPSLHSSLSTPVPLISTNFVMMYDNDVKQQKHVSSAFVLPSFCDNPQMNFLCSKQNRDISSSSSSSSSSLLSISNRLLYSLFTTSMNNVTSNTIPIDSSTTKSTVRQCAALKGSRYEYFWDNVWEWIDVCLYALIPFTVMSIGTFFIVYRVYYQQRVFRSRRSASSSQTGGSTQNKAKSLFYLLFTLNLLYFILVSPVVLVTTILFRNPNEEVAYPRFKAIIYLMQYCNHSLNFVFYGITSRPYRQTLYERFKLLTPHFPRCFQRIIARPQSKSVPKRIDRPKNASPAKQLRMSIKKNQQILTTTFDNLNTAKIPIDDDPNDNDEKKCISL